MHNAGGPPGTPQGTDPLPPLPDDVALPIVLVHGFAGSAQQIESDAIRFVAHGYPAQRIVAYDHITATNLPRGDAGRPQTRTTPNWPSAEHTVSLVFSDFPVDGAA